ncbi:hypothetical protein E8E14_008894 [Neopestalotiopsis sp. 37M]|nr:hypothetical protein E8E14_008894 [Neopestalotiopsis sp. 37M]
MHFILAASAIGAAFISFASSLAIADKETVETRGLRAGWSYYGCTERPPSAEVTLVDQIGMTRESVTSSDTVSDIPTSTSSSDTTTSMVASTISSEILTTSEATATSSGSMSETSAPDATTTSSSSESDTTSSDITTSIFSTTSSEVTTTSSGSVSETTSSDVVTSTSSATTSDVPTSATVTGPCATITGTFVLQGSGTGDFAVDGNFAQLQSAFGSGYRTTFSANRQNAQQFRFNADCTFSTSEGRLLAMVGGNANLHYQYFFPSVEEASALVNVSWEADLCSMNADNTLTCTAMQQSIFQVTQGDPLLQIGDQNYGEALTINLIPVPTGSFD